MKKTKCPKCGQSIGFKDHNEGRQIKCPHCEALVRLSVETSKQDAAIEQVSKQLEEVDDPSTVAVVFRTIKNRIFGKRGDKNRPRKPLSIVFLQVYGFLLLVYGFYGLFTSKLGATFGVSSLSSLLSGLGGDLGQSAAGNADKSIPHLQAIQGTLVSGFYACLGAICFIGSMIAEYTFYIWRHLKMENK